MISAMDRTQAIEARVVGRVGALGETVDKGVATATGDFTNILLLLGGGFAIWLLFQFAAPAGYGAASHSKRAYRKFKDAGPKPKAAPQVVEAPLDVEFLPPSRPYGQDWLQQQRVARHAYV